MIEESFPKQALDKFRQWHFWWLIVFSFLLIITFVYYLPTRFLQQSGVMRGHEEDKRMQEHMEQGMTEEEMNKHMEEESGDQMMPVHRSLGEGGDEHMEDEMMNGGMMGDHAEEESGGIYHEENDVKEGLAVNLNVSPVPYNVGVPLRLDFFVNTKPGNVLVLANQLQLEHTKLMHVVGLRSDMNEFFHVHPEFLADNPSIFSIDHVFKKPGLYKIWSLVKKDSIDHTFGHPEVNINGAGPREEKKPFDPAQGKKVSFLRNVITGNYQVSLEVNDVIVKDKEVDLSFDIHSLTGQEVEVEQYLGADMHLVIIKDDRSRFIHTHPIGSSHAEGMSMTSNGTSPESYIPVALAHGGIEDEPAGATDEHQNTKGVSDETISFHIIFPEAGLYKAFVQFRPRGIILSADEALLAEFWIQVEEKVSFPVSQWWGLLIVSVLLIAGLSWLVKRYLVVKAEDVKMNVK